MGKGDPFNGHEYVDLHLPSGTLWATKNIGAWNYYNSGYFYQYGKGNRQYNETYNENNYTGIENPLSLSVDPAQQAWGGEWHVPTKEQFEELMRRFNGQGDNGFLFEWDYYTGEYIILPVSGYMYMGSLQDDGIYGYYMTSTPNGTTYQNFNFCVNASEEQCTIYPGVRTMGVMVRPVVG